MSIESRGGIAIVKIPAGVCLLQSSAAAFVMELTNFAEEVHRTRPVRGVLVLQESPADDRVASWQEELDRRALLKDLAATIYGWRWLLSLIRNSPVPWLYASASDALGSAFELALSCQRRYWFDGRAVLGFPEIAAGAFPCGGVLESLSKRSGRTQDRWFGKQTLSADAAMQDGLLHFCASARDWSGAATAMFYDLLAESPRVGVRDPSSQLESIAAGLRQPTVGAAPAFDVKRPVSATLSAWEACWDLVKERSRFATAHELGWAIAHVAARHLLSVPFLRSLEAHITVPPAIPTCAPVPTLVGLDLDHLTPPTESLIKLAKAGVRMMLTASESDSLATALNLVFARLERSLGGQAAQDLWRQSFAWCQAEADRLPLPILRWTIDDRLVVVHGATRFEYLRLEGNAGMAGAGALEVLSSAGSEDATADSLRCLAAMTADAIVTTAGDTAALPRSVLVRSYVFQELVRISRHTEGDISQATQHLAACGWRFAGNEEAWDRFLKARIDACGPDALPLSPPAGPLDRALWDVGAWRHAKAMARKSLDAKALRWNATRTSHHIALFAGLLARSLGASKTEDANEVDRLVSLALGFPETYGSPTGFVDRRGERRTRYYLAREWPGRNFAQAQIT